MYAALKAKPHVLMTLVIGEESRDLVFTPSQKLAFAGNVILNDDGLHYSLPGTESALMVPGGNTASLSERPASPTLLFGSDDEITIRIVAGVTPGTNCKLGVVTFDGNGAKTGRAQFGLDTGSSVPFKPSPGTTEALLFLQVSGQGVIPSIRIAIEGLPGREAPTSIAQALVPPRRVTAGSDLIAQASDLIVRKHYVAAIDLLESAPESKARRRHLMRAYTAIGYYDMGVALFHDSDAALQAEPTFRYRFIECCANTGAHEQAQQVMRRAAYELDDKSLDLLARTYRFAGGLPAEVKDLIRGRLQGGIEHFRRQPLRLLRVAHDLVEERRFSEASLLGSQLVAHCSNAAEIARVRLLQSQIAFRLNDPAGQLDLANEALQATGVAPVAAIDPDDYFDASNLRPARGLSAINTGPKISVLMTTFNSQETVGYALKSVLDQTYRNIEVFVIDDCSSDLSIKAAKKAAKGDARVQFISMDRNGGTYVAKNTALARATGDYVTCQDSDDWAHPQKLEFLLAAVSSGDKLAAVVQHLRCSRLIGVQCRNDYVRPDFSSLLYRRQDVLERIGFYDSVRAGADSEHQARMVKAFGDGCIASISRLLSIVAWSPETLSGGGAFAIDDDAGIFSPVRAEYRRSFQMWHERETDLMVPFPLAARSFPAPEPLCRIG